MASAPHGSHSGFNFGCFVIPIVIVVGTTVSYASAVEEFKVGDVEGWRQPDINHTEIYTLWAATKRFHVGDLLRFEYRNDSVVVVDKRAYYHCNVTSPSSVFTDGNTTINLDNVGPMYFISGNNEHCQNGQRLAVEVMPLLPQSPPPSSPPQYQEPEAEDSPTPSPVSTSNAATHAQELAVSRTLSSSVLVTTFIALSWHSA
ncbi:NtEPc [Heracleum sosnowskyi]|uniref:NtEPc n=1 Tax=Heracleum sosnowskyi TaxID=360622 RepID=A0AAD8H7W9_9APIA|nr:NtEPc [Heracleum sosnowskyi]